MTTSTDSTPHKGVTGIKRVWNAFLPPRWMASKRPTPTKRPSARSLACHCSDPHCTDSQRTLITQSPANQSVLLVMLTELLNSGIEAVVDRISYEHHELSKRAKVAFMVLYYLESC